MCLPSERDQERHTYVTQWTRKPLRTAAEPTLLQFYALAAIQTKVGCTCCKVEKAI